MGPREPRILLAIVGLALAASAIRPHDQALLLGSSADSFLGTQGDVWDTQWDMFLALVGALSAQLILSRFHDRALARLRE